MSIDFGHITFDFNTLTFEAKDEIGEKQMQKLPTAQNVLDLEELRELRRLCP